MSSFGFAIKNPCGTYVSYSSGQVMAFSKRVDADKYVGDLPYKTAKDLKIVELIEAPEPVATTVMGDTPEGRLQVYGELVKVISREPAKTTETYVQMVERFIQERNEARTALKDVLYALDNFGDRVRGIVGV